MSSHSFDSGSKSWNGGSRPRTDRSGSSNVSVRPAGSLSTSRGCGAPGAETSGGGWNVGAASRYVIEIVGESRLRLLSERRNLLSFHWPSSSLRA